VNSTCGAAGTCSTFLHEYRQKKIIITKDRDPVFLMVFKLIIFHEQKPHQI
jgi:16S rRNA C1402 N4-methylase RsmH